MSWKSHWCDAAIKVAEASGFSIYESADGRLTLGGKDVQGVAIDFAEANAHAKRADDAAETAIEAAAKELAARLAEQAAKAAAEKAAAEKAQAAAKDQAAV